MIKKWSEFNSVDLRKNYIGLSTEDIWSIFLEMKDGFGDKLDIIIEYGNTHYNERTRKHNYSSIELRSVFTNRKCINIMFELNINVSVRQAFLFNEYIKDATKRLSSMGYDFIWYDSRSNKQLTNNIVTKDVLCHKYLIIKKV